MPRQTLLVIALALAATSLGPAEAPPDADPLARVLATAPAPDRHGDPLPAGATARLGTLRWRHPFEAGSGHGQVVVSSDGHWVVAAADAGCRLFDSRTGRVVRAFPAAVPVRAVCFTPSGSWVLTCGGAPARLQRWDRGSGHLLHEVLLPGDLKTIYNTASFSPDGNLLSVTHCDPAGGSRPATVTIHDAADGRTLRTLPFTEGHVSAARFSPGGRHAAVQRGFAELPIYVYEVGTGRRLHTIDRRTEGHSFKGFAPQGDRFLTVRSAGGVGRDQTRSLCVWDLAEARVVRTVEGWGGFLAFSPDGKLLAGDDGEALRVLTWPALAEVRRFGPHGGGVRGLTFTPDGLRVLSTHGEALAVWDVATGRPLHEKPGHAARVNALAYSGDGRLLASAGSDRRVLVWDVATASVRHDLEGQEPAALSVALSPDGRSVATGASPAREGPTPGRSPVNLWRPGDGERLGPWPGHRGNTTVARFAPDGKRLAVASWRGSVQGWDVGAGAVLFDTEGLQGPVALAFAPDGRTLLVGVGTGRLLACEAATGQVVRELAPAGSPPVYALGFLRDGTAWSVEEGNRAAWPRGGALRRWDITTGRPLRRTSFAAGDLHLGRPVAVSPDGTTVATAAHTGGPDRVQLWDGADGRLLAELRGHDGLINALVFAPEGRTLASAGNDTTVLLWDVPALREQHRWRALVQGHKEAEHLAQRLAANPATGLSHLSGRLRHTARVEGETRRLARRLDSADFRVREEATAGLVRLGPDAISALELLLEEPQTAEAGTRLRAALANVRAGGRTSTALDPGQVRHALAILAGMRTPAARTLLRDLEAGPPEVLVTRQARDALRRP